MESAIFDAIRFVTGGSTPPIRSFCLTIFYQKSFLFSSIYGAGGLFDGVSGNAAS